MTITAQIQCINKSDRFNPHERILNVGGINPDGTRWKLTQKQAIEGIENKTYAFYVTRNGTMSSVIVATSQYGYKYLKTSADNAESNNLLYLPECP